jgi:hypothetical protein
LESEADSDSEQAALGIEAVFEKAPTPVKKLTPFGLSPVKTLTILSISSNSKASEGEELPLVKKPTAVMSFTSPLCGNMMSPNGPSWNSGDSYEEFPGSKTSPHIINVNIQYPECNHECDVEHVQNIKHDPHISTGFHIRCSSAV